MKNTIKKAAISTGEFVAKHKVAIAVITTAVTTAVVVKKVTGVDYDSAMTFIGEKGLMGEFEHYTSNFENVID